MPQEDRTPAPLEQATEAALDALYRWARWGDLEDRLKALGACRAAVGAAEGRSVDLDGHEVPLVERPRHLHEEQVILPGLGQPRGPHHRALFPVTPSLEALSLHEVQAGSR